MTRCARAVLFGFLLISGPVAAQDATVVANNGPWTAYTMTEGDNLLCFMSAKPEKAEGNYTRRGETLALVTHRPAENANNVVSTVAGYTYKEDTDVSWRIGNKTFQLFTNGERAWARRASEDEDIVESMIAGNRLVVKGTSSRDTLTTDTYSLIGFTATYRSMSEACGVDN